MPNPPGANRLVAERTFPASDYWGRTGVAKCAEEVTGICRLLTACHTQDCEDLQGGPFSYQGVSTRGGRHSPDLCTANEARKCPEMFARTLPNSLPDPQEFSLVDVSAPKKNI